MFARIPRAQLEPVPATHGYQEPSVTLLVPDCSLMVVPRTKGPALPSHISPISFHFRLCPEMM